MCWAQHAGPDTMLSGVGGPGRASLPELGSSRDKGVP